ncbi:MAG: ABC transporter substrate-binding protein [Roseitalea sp.]|jgi:putative ABC transport system substrate-binding protein|uniref:ABC transporter substrate-binding protein n=1 Tax=Oceaniradius stylonematis TaxID=2184161 RepID=A0A3A8ACR4_9HYPH|nr:ABC transporter substrate-binding protein [Oceaniradius stylonematis]MBO6552013.1 ABC transporter substrate-binding protein [Roseitalea sp.]MBO6951607.1 ABC transporter substrate-binding protein [Rhizobiaceae bacterium]RNC95933.1 MAG: ABC transporter substrate-binding protein [Oricola sp.]MBO6592547.1 ABC transporter substrate-binding protein [Roseitalea sp.]MBO6598802.1 ABC transporter substrate-binding protein [Roseitalea sp.]
MFRKKAASFAAAALISAACSVASATEMTQVAITYIIDHPAIDAARMGIVDELEAHGFKEGETLELRVQSAQGSMPTQLQIAKEFAGLEPDLLVAISTPSAQALQSTAGDIPLLFAAVTDPVGAKLVESIEAPGGNITGTTDKQPFGPTLALIKTLVPDAKRIGVIYNAGEANSVSQVAALKVELEAHGLEIEESTASQTAMVADAALSLAGRADAILIPTDSTIVAAVESVVNVGERAKIPVFASDTDSVERGALAALGFDYYKLGRLTGEMAVRVLNGESPAAIPVGALDTQDLYLNTSAAAAMGVTLPDDILEQATKVIQ